MALRFSRNLHLSIVEDQYLSKGSPKENHHFGDPPNQGLPDKLWNPWHVSQELCVCNHPPKNEETRAARKNTMEKTKTNECSFSALLQARVTPLRVPFLSPPSQRAATYCTSLSMSLEGGGAGGQGLLREPAFNFHGVHASKMHFGTYSVKTAGKCRAADGKPTGNSEPHRVGSEVGQPVETAGSFSTGKQLPGRRDIPEVPAFK